MSYYHEKNYSGDMESNHSFRLSRLTCSSWAALEMEKAYRAIEDGTRPHTEGICALFECSEKEAEALSVLAHFDGYVSSPVRLACLLSLKAGELHQVLGFLYDKGLINQIHGAESIILSRNAVLSITRSRNVEQLSDDVVLDWLRETDPTDGELLLNDNGLPVSLVSRAGNPLDGRIGRFARELKGQGLSSEAIHIFWNLCISYVNAFTAPYPLAFLRPAMSELVKIGWVETYASGGEGANDLTVKDNHCLSSSLAAKLFAGREELIDYSAISALGIFKSWTSIDEKTLFFNDSDREALERIERISGTSEYERIKKGLDERHLRVSISSVFHGPSGTGKTEFAMQMARKTKRDIILVDASKLHGSFWGEDERNFRDLFRIFRHIEALSKNAPILFIDEGEAILGQRTTNASTRADRSSNIVQNIILEELNAFRGILIVTTNDASGIDKAMDRRFLTKVEFHVPDAVTRKKIWTSKMEGRISDAEAEVLAERFAFSGGHIDNVVTQSAIDEILEDRECDMEGLIGYCMKEESFSSMNAQRKIGF